MANFFSFNRNQATVLLTLILVLVLGAVYFFIYVPGNQSALEEQRFRYLRKIEKSIHAKIDNAVALLNNELVSYQNDSPAFPRVRVQESIRKNPPANLVLYPIDLLSSTESWSPGDSTGNVVFNSQDLTVYLTKGKYKTRLKFTISQFIDSLLPRDVFDQYILLQGDAVVYQSFPIGVTGIFNDSLLNNKSVFAGNSVRDITLSGIDFKLFSQQLNLNGATSLTIVGLLTKEHYQREKTKLPDAVVLLLLTIAISTILALPWIKLYQMGNQDRLTTADNLFSFGVSMLLMSLLFFGFFKYNIPFRPVKEQDEIIKRNLADGIDTSFSAEITNAYNRLAELHKLRKENNIIYSLQNFEKKNVRSVRDSLLSALPENIKNQLNTKKYDLEVSQVFWLGNDGVEVTNWAAASENTPPGNFGNRDYFKILVNGTPFLMGHDINKKFYLEQVVSWTTNKFRSVLSQRYIGKDTLVAAISLDLKSVKQVVLPAGFTYSIINEEGRVLYNSKLSKNLNENLIEEFSEHQQLKATVIADREAFFTTKYIGNDYQVFVKPMEILPYYIVIMENTSIGNVRDMKIFGFTLLMLLSFFAFLVVQFVVVFFVSRRRNFFTRQYLDISWIGPHKSFHHTYHEIIIWNILNILVLTILHYWISFLPFLFILLFTTTAVSIFLNLQFLRWYKNEGDPRYKLKRKAVVALCFILFLINMLAFKAIRFSWIYLYEIGWLILSWFFFAKNEPVFAVLHRWKARLPSFAWNFSHSFSLMVFTRLIISSGIPAASFYTAAFDYETNLIGKYRHTRFIKDAIAKTDHKKEKLNLSAVYFDRIWVNKPEEPVNYTDSIPEQDESWLFDYMTSYNLAGANELYRHYPKGLFKYKKVNNGGIIQTVYKDSDTHFVSIASSPLRYRVTDFTTPANVFRSVSYLLAFAFGLFIFWYFLHRIIRKLFALNLPSQSGWKEIDNGITTDNILNNRLFVIGSPGTDIAAKLIDLIKDKTIKDRNEQILIYDEKDKLNNTVFFADMRLVPSSEAVAKDNKIWNALSKESLKGKYALVIIDYFQYDIQNQEANLLKLDFLENLLHADHAKVIIISTIHPVNFLDSLNQQESPGPADKKMPQHNLERWHGLLGSFTIAIEKLNARPWTMDDKLPLWKTILVREAKSTSFLSSISGSVIKSLEAKTPKYAQSFDGNDLAFKMETSSSYFYMSIWQSLTKEEKFILYDLAEDGLVNPFDENNLSLLINKGLIVKTNGGLVVFNKGFRDFILTSIGASEALKIRDQIRDNGNWNKLKTPLKILVFAVLAFLFTSQQEAYSTLLKYLSIMTVAVPAALKFFALFEKSSAKSN